MAFQWPFELDTFQKQAVLKLEQVLLLPLLLLLLLLLLLFQKPSMPWSVSRGWGAWVREQGVEGGG